MALKPISVLYTVDGHYKKSGLGYQQECGYIELRQYKALRCTQTTLKDDDPDWEPWVGFFSALFEKQKANLAIQVKQEKIDSNRAMPLLSVEALKLLGEHERLAIARMVEITVRTKTRLMLGCVSWSTRVVSSVTGNLGQLGIASLE